MNHIVTGFMAGEVSPLAQSRVDLEALRTAAVKMRNMIPIGLGAAMQRPGMLFCGRAYNEAYAVRLIPYTYSRGVTYHIELGNYYARFWKDGAVVGSVLETPWSASEIFDIRFTSANDVVWCSHRSHWPRRLIRETATSWRIEKMPVVFPALRDMNAKEVTISASATTGTVDLVASAAVFDAGDVGGYYGIAHRRDLPIVELNLGLGSASASAALSLVATQPGDGEAVSIGDKVYTFKTTPLAAYEVARGANIAASRENLIKMVNGETSGTPAHALVSASDGGSVAGGTYASAVLTIGPNQPGVGVTVTVDGVSVTSVASSPAAGQFAIGATQEDTLDNIITALNASLSTAQMQPRVGKQSVCKAVTAGAAGNAIAVSETSTYLSWSTANLAGGVDSNTERINIKARTPGVGGNGIALSETLSAGSWGGTETTGGITLELASDPISVLGDCEVFTYGRWNGELFLETEREPGTWHTLRAWKSANDFNAQSTITIEDGKRVRLRYVGTGTEADGAYPRAMLTALDAFVTGIVEITAVADSTHATGNVIKTLHSTAATYDWSEGAWSDRRGYPAAVALHEQRLVFGRDITVWGSQVSGFDNFERSTLEDGAFAYELAAAQGNEILNIVSHRGLIVLTDGDEWLLDGGPQSSSITASKVRAERKSGYGSAPVAPVILAASVLFVEAGSRKLDEYVFDFQSEGYEAVDLSELAEHLVAEKITCMAWAPNPYGILWAVTASGSLLSMTYRRKAGMIAWAKHTTPHGAFESVSAVPGADGITEVWFSVRRTVAGVTMRTIERFDPEHWQKMASDTKAALCVADGAVIGSGATISGLNHMEGLQVGVLGDGAIQTSRIVTAASVTIEAAADSVVVGLPVETTLQVMPAMFITNAGMSFGKQYRVAAMAARFYQSGGGQYGDTPTAKFYDLSFRKGTNPTGEAAPLFTGQQRLDVAGSWEDGTTVTFRNSSMLPLNITALVLQTSVQ